jgi:hypothetical protein
MANQPTTDAQSALIRDTDLAHREERQASGGSGTATVAGPSTAQPANQSSSKGGGRSKA